MLATAPGIILVKDTRSENTEQTEYLFCETKAYVHAHYKRQEKKDVLLYDGSGHNNGG